MRSRAGLVSLLDDQCRGVDAEHSVSGQLEAAQLLV